MALTKVQVISNALTLLGKKPILTLDNSDSITTAMEQAFDYKYLTALETGFWRFATTIVQLAQSTQTPIGGYYSYAYILPGNFHKLVHLWPNFYDWDLYENKLLYANYNDQGGQGLFLEYVFNPAFEFVPNYFWDFFIYELALYACLSNAQSVQYYEALKPEREIKWAIALAADCQNRPQMSLKSKPMISRRFVSTFASG